METRHYRLIQDAELRAAPDSRKVRGYAAVFDSASRPLGPTKYREYIRRGAFLRSLRHDIVGLYNHDTEHVLGRTSAGTMSLSEDATGLATEIERADALAHYDEILESADGIMIARGDLGVEVPIEEIAIIQKQLILKANTAGKPVITATQMLESMVSNRLPTRAESTDVANAILDGTDCVMLSGESAMGHFPEESVAMLARIAAATETGHPFAWRNAFHDVAQKSFTAAQAMGMVVKNALETAPCAAVFVPTRSGDTARMISRFKPSVWIVAVGEDRSVLQGLRFSYGVDTFKSKQTRRTGAISPNAGFTIINKQETLHYLWQRHHLVTPTQIIGSNSCESAKCNDWVYGGQGGS
jgi:pyruvate kinase